jgi:hypothetical protein
MPVLRLRDLLDELPFSRQVAVLNRAEAFEDREANGAKEGSGRTGV